MFKRVMTILISVLAMVFLGLLLYRLPRGGQGTDLNIFAVEPSQRATTEEHVINVDRVGGVSYGRFEVFKRDKDGRLIYAIRARQRPVENTGRSLLDQPDIRLYSTKGEELRITAPRGFIDVEGAVVASIDDIKKGRLSDGVVIRHDRGTPGDDADDLVVTMDHCDYDQRTAQLYTDDPVMVRGPEVEIDATGLRIFLVPGETELRELQLLKDVHIVLWQGGEKLQMQLTPTAPGEAGRQPLTGRTAEGEAQTPAEQAGDAGGDAKKPYRFVLQNNVRVTRGDQGLETDEQVTLHVRMRDRRQDEAEDRSGTPAGTGAAPASGDATPEPSPTVRRQPDAVPVDIRCDGPFTYAPVAPKEAPRDIRLEATGRKVVVWDDQMRATGQVLKFDGATGQGELTASENVTVVLRDDATVTTREVRFDRSAGTVWFNGAGNLVAKVSGGGLGLERAKSDEPFVATWSDKMQVGFGSGDRLGADGKPVLGTDGKAEQRNFLNWAEFYGRAELKQGVQSLSGDFIRVDLFPPAPGPQDDRERQAIKRVVARDRVAVRQPKTGERAAVGDMTCGEFEFDFRRSDDGSSRPERFVARDDVVAVHEDGHIEAGVLKAWFGPHPEKPEDDRITRMIAETDVRARQTYRGRELYAEGVYLELDEDTGQMTLRGTEQAWAVASQGPQTLRGIDIRMDRAKGRADVAGPGTLKLLSDRGLEGQKIDEPMPVHIAWTRKMSFDRGTNTAHFSGDVQTRTPRGSIDCADLWVFFYDTEDEGSEPPAGAGPGEEMFGGLGLGRLTAVENVVARTVSTPKDAAKDLSATTLRCGKLEYNALKEKAVVDGAGTMEILEVSRIPAGVVPHKRPPHRTTVVTWKRAMIFDRKDLVAWFGQDVVVDVKAAGRRDAELEGMRLNLSGKSTLACQVLRLYLARAEGMEDAAGREGIALKEMVATCGPEPPWVSTVSPVSFSDGVYSGTAERMTYDHVKRLIVLTGSPARIMQRDEAGRSFRQEARQMSFWRDQGKIEVLQPWGTTLRPSRDFDLRR